MKKEIMISDDLFYFLNEYIKNQKISFDSLVNDALKEYRKKLEKRKKREVLNWIIKHPIDTNIDDLKVIQKVKSENFS